MSDNNGSSQENTAIQTAGEKDDYRQSVKKLLDSSIKNVMEEELQKAAQELMEEQRKVIKQIIEEQRAVLREIIEEEKKDIHARAEELRKSILNLGLFS